MYLTCAMSAIDGTLVIIVPFPLVLKQALTPPVRETTIILFVTYFIRVLRVLVCYYSMKMKVVI